MSELLRATLKAHDNGQVFPVYVNTREEADDAARALNATVVSVEPTTEGALVVEQLEWCFTKALGYQS